MYAHYLYKILRVINIFLQVGLGIKWVLCNVCIFNRTHYRNSNSSYTIYIWSSRRFYIEVASRMNHEIAACRDIYHLGP